MPRAEHLRNSVEAAAPAPPETFEDPIQGLRREVAVPSPPAPLEDPGQGLRSEDAVPAPPLPFEDPVQGLRNEHDWFPTSEESAPERSSIIRKRRSRRTTRQIASVFQCLEDDEAGTVFMAIKQQPESAAAAAAAQEPVQPPPTPAARPKPRAKPKSKMSYLVPNPNGPCVDGCDPNACSRLGSGPWTVKTTCFSCGHSTTRPRQLPVPEDPSTCQHLNKDNRGSSKKGHVTFCKDCQTVVDRMPQEEWKQRCNLGSAARDSSSATANTIAKAVLQSDVPIEKSDAERILELYNRMQKGLCNKSKRPKHAPLQRRWSPAYKMP